MKNKCWKSIRSPPLIGSKNEVLKCLSKIIIVIQPANTGNDIINRNEVKNIDHGNKGINNDEYKMLKLHDFNKVIIKKVK